MDINKYKKNEQFLINIFKEKLYISTQYLSIPSEICFTFCLNETIHNLRLNIENSKINHLYLIEDFYNFLVDDKIFRKIDESEYYNLLNYLQKAIGSAISSKELLLYLISVRSLFGKKYLNCIYDEIKLSFEDEKYSKDDLYFLYKTFLNEIIVNKCCYQCLIKIFDCFIKDKFVSLQNFLDYLWGVNEENIEILVPIKNCNSDDQAFLQNYNQMEEIDNVKYLKIYENNTIDHVRLFEKQKKRIDVYFNIIKFYGSSNIDYSYDSKAFIKKKVLNDTFELKLREITSYNPFLGSTDMRDNSLSTMYTLFDEENYDLYYSINDILAYAERDNDVMNSASFVDNWISIESLIKLSKSKNGIEGVTQYIPKMLAIEFFRKDLNTLLKGVYKNMTIERFVQLIYEGNLKESYSKNEYLKWKVSKYIDIIKKPKNLLDELIKIETKLEKDLKRIYIIRNEYVHSSNVDVYNNTSKLKLKHLLSFGLDCFFKTLNNNIKNEHYTVSGEELFSDITKNYHNRNNVLIALSGEYKINNKKIGQDLIGHSLEKYQIITNIILNRRNSLNVYYENQNSFPKKREKTKC